MARPRHRLGNLPSELTSFVGRRRERDEIRKKLTTARLVSLVGPGGVGKTRLATRTAADLGRGFADGAWLVELAEVRDGTLVSNAVVAALDLRDQAATTPLQIVVSYLRDKQLLLVVDNCEHLLGPAAEVVAEVLRSAPNVRVITTSREPLQVAGEHVVPIPPLELPQRDGEETLDQLRHNEAVTLFSERAAAASGAFELTGSNKGAVVALCRRLDGLPLAIELAAVRTRVLAVEQILDRLSDRFALLAGAGRAALPRHQTLRTTMDWSYDLLTVAEQALFRRLSVFAARFTLDDVESVCTSDDVEPTHALDVLSSLVDKSLVTRDDVKNLACYRLHESMREYAKLKLRDADEEEVLEDRCLEYYRTRCLRTADRARYQIIEWLGWAELEIDNIRAVLHQCLARGDFVRGLDIAASMTYYWITHGTTESMRWLDQLLASGEASPHTQVRALYLRGRLSVIQADCAAARPWIARAIATARETRQLSQLSQSLSLAATAESMAGDLEGARRYLDEAEAMTPGLNDFPATIELVQSRGIYAIFQGDLDTARAASSEGVRLSREAGDLHQLETMLRHLGQVALMTGDIHSSKRWFVEAGQLARQIDNRLAQYYLLAVLSWFAATSGQGRLAAQLLGAAEAAGIQVGAGIVGPLPQSLEQAKVSAVAALGSAKFEAEFEAGKRLGRDAAVRLALGESSPAKVAASEGVDTGPLAKRELEVARLIATGLSNKEIASRLFISDRTVASHVGNILNKLGVNSRSQVAGWMASSDR